jgi:toxin FitB
LLDVAVELGKGVALKERTDPVAARQISAWVDGLEYSFADRLLGIDAVTATFWGRASAERPRPVVDTLLAATAQQHKLTLVTRNTADVVDMQVVLLNPWEG